MKKVTLIFICLVLILCMTACSVRPKEESKEDLNARALGQSFDVVNVWRDFCNACPDRESFSQGEKDAADYIKGMFGSCGLEQYYADGFIQSVDYGGETTTQNVVGIIKGENTDKNVVIGAHYDNVGEINSEGANDNASGVAVLLGLAKYFSDKTLPFNLVFVAFGGEEAGYVGSGHFVNNFDMDSILLFINIDSVANGKYLYAYAQDYKTDYCDYFLKTYGESDLFLKTISVPPTDLGATFLVESYNKEYSAQYFNTDALAFDYCGIPTISFFAGDMEYSYSYIESKDENERVMHTSDDNVLVLEGFGDDYKYNMQSVFNCVCLTIGSENFFATAIDAKNQLYGVLSYLNLISVIVCFVVLVVFAVVCFNVYKKLKKRAVVKEEPLKNFTLFSRPNDEEIFTF